MADRTSQDAQNRARSRNSPNANRNLFQTGLGSMFGHNSNPIAASQTGATDTGHAQDRESRDFRSTASRTLQQGAQSRFGQFDARSALQQTIVGRGRALEGVNRRFSPSRRFGQASGQTGLGISTGSSDNFGEDSGTNPDAFGQSSSQLDTGNTTRPQRTIRSTSRSATQRNVESSPITEEDIIRVNRRSKRSRSPGSQIPAGSTQPVSTERIRRARERRDWDRLRGNHDTVADATLESEKRHAKRQRRGPGQ